MFRPVEQQLWFDTKASTLKWSKHGELNSGTANSSVIQPPEVGADVVLVLSLM